MLDVLTKKRTSAEVFLRAVLLHHRLKNFNGLSNFRSFKSKLLSHGKLVVFFLDYGVEFQSQRSCDVWKMV